MWQCPKLNRYWADVLHHISNLAQVPVPLTPLVFLLGAIDVEMYPKGMYLMITRLLYLATKFKARHWMASTGKQWITYVNSLLLKEQVAYCHRNAASKLNLIWQPWLDHPSLAPPQFVMDRLLRL